jgi:hypothetical protein
LVKQAFGDHSEVDVGSPVDLSISPIAAKTEAKATRANEDHSARMYGKSCCNSFAQLKVLFRLETHRFASSYMKANDSRYVKTLQVSTKDCYTALVLRRHMMAAQPIRLGSLTASAASRPRRSRQRQRSKPGAQGAAYATARGGCPRENREGQELETTSFFRVDEQLAVVAGYLFGRA